MRNDARADRGSLIIIALILVIVVMGLAGSYLVVAHAVSHRVVESVEQARALAAAEAGIDHARVGLLALVDPTSLTPAAAWQPVLSANDGWLSFATGVATQEGSYSVRALDNDDGDGNPYADTDETLVLESIGHGTKQGPDGRTQVIRCIVTLEVHDPTERYAVLTGDDLYVFGDQEVDGTLGRVHANADLTVQGNVSISRSASASAETTAIGAGQDVAEGLRSDQPIVPIKPVIPADYRPYANRILTSDGRVLDGATGLVLYDFNGTVTTTTRKGRKGSGTSGSIGGGSFEGFTWSSSVGWSTATSGWVEGMYYVESSISFQHGGTAGTPWRVTLVAEGSISMTGNPFLEPYFNDAELLVAGEDVYARGTGSNAILEGLILAHEQVDLSGNITFHGRVLSESLGNTSGSAVDRRDDPLLCSLGGGVVIQYDGRLHRSLVTDYRLPARSWQEELPTHVAAAPPPSGGPSEPAPPSRGK